MISLLQFDVTDEADFTERLRTALRVLAARPGYLRGSAGRSTDDPGRWILVTEWANVGSYRRALGAYDVKLYATPLLAQAIDQPSAFEPLLIAEPDGEPTSGESDRA
jgi:heme oxygenase (mycobilin-producing)